ncbi:uncharacterized protein FIESC28_01856 [Fusarium coffeatum]|uniref:AAA+ ATPase domain-containing protein n=1 Tax=Fusarium coffeatum TaxID=231269 RepID=A0A366S7Z4_9HYPO|nr:uncharacterized protein FIESC28_01856 [Fusarium coffeatum]RBR25419.1 hypothetical protein FIESC28_01856 [Fusarium coffeatum]
MQHQQRLFDLDIKKRANIAERVQDTTLTNEALAQSSTKKAMPVTSMDADAERGKNVGSSQDPAGYIKIAQLEQKIQKLRSLQNTFKSTTWLLLHKIQGDETTYLQRPSWLPVLGRSPQLKGISPLANEAKYLKQRPDAAFVVYRHYDSTYQERDIGKFDDEETAFPDPKPVREVIQTLSPQMVAALDAFVDSHPTFSERFPVWKSDEPIDSPFLFWYYYRGSTNIETIAEPHKKQMQLLTQWIDNNYGKTHTEVEAHFSRGYISEQTMPFFVRPGEVLVSKTAKGIQGYIAKSWATKVESGDIPSIQPNVPDSVSQSWKIDAWSYGYDGKFYIKSTTLKVTLEFNEGSLYANIMDLDILPMRLSTKESQTLLERRGKTMWACRKRNLVTYNHVIDGNTVGEGERYMMDFDTYKQLHSDSKNFTEAYPELGSWKRKEMDASIMDSEQMPQGSESFVFPSTIVGYNLRQKKWQDLHVDYIQPVHWNKQAFRHLVIDKEIKDIIQALVTSKLATDQTTDFIQGKGNGLIILLHGGPGTGKTFTAESVAELAEKPLFRVTCGDIGTKPEEVEKYLESVLHLGKIWDCVVLLDEADVFLEQRTLTDLERNALVSVFLRVLEYYEGILILTSNRVGTFDEAFKSRIQLSLHYESLIKSQRRSIWENFLDRLSALEQESTVVQPITDRKRKLEQDPGIDFDDIERHLADLAEEQMNGRQIRNAITTARQLAKFKNESMTYRHLEHVIKISRKFDKYLERVRDSYTDDQVAREEGIR